MTSRTFPFSLASSLILLAACDSPGGGAVHGDATVDTTVADATGDTGVDNSGDDDASTAGGATFAEVYDLLQACTFCHGTRLPRGGFSLGVDAESAYAALVDVPASNDLCTDPPHTRVVPGHPEQSLLYEKLSGTQDCGDPMPSPNGEINPVPFTPEQLETVRSWIAAGALDD
ncbi:MAG: hypothetical protein U1F43_04185 [Myxococcota bacterium]